MTADDARDVPALSGAREASVTYVDRDPVIPTHLGTDAPHVHHRGSDRCLRAPDGVTCPTPAELRAEVERWKRAEADQTDLLRDVFAILGGDPVKDTVDVLARRVVAERDALQQQVANAGARALLDLADEMDAPHWGHVDDWCVPVIYSERLRKRAAALAPSTERRPLATTVDPREVIDCGLGLDPDRAAVLARRVLDAEQQVANVRALVERRDTAYPSKFAFGAHENYVAGARSVREEILAALGGPAAPTRWDEETDALFVDAARRAAPSVGHAQEPQPTGEVGA